jgi:hypothetical protein
MIITLITGVPYIGATLWLLKAEGHIGAILLGPYYERVLLLLVAVVLANARLKQLSRLVIFREHHDLGLFLLQRMSAGPNATYSRAPTFTTTPRQKPVPLSNQSLFLSS